MPGIIDIHHHAIPDFWFQEAQAGISAQTAGAIGPQWRNWTPEVSLAGMDKNGVDLALLSISAPGTWFGDRRKARSLTRRCNEAMAKAMHDRPDRFGFHATLAMPDVEGSLKEVEYAFDTLKADGVGLMTSYLGRYIGDPLFDPVFAELNRRKAVIYVHPVSPACCTTLTPFVPPNFVEFLHDTNRAILNVMSSGTLARYPDLSFIFSHAGGTLPVAAGRVTGNYQTYPQLAANVPGGFMAALKRLHFDVATSTNPTTFNALTSLVPTTQVVFGSDYPVVPYEGTRPGLLALKLPAEDLARIARTNALRLYPQVAARVRKA